MWRLIMTLPGFARRYAVRELYSLGRLKKHLRILGFPFQILQGCPYA
jgi:hypothetical protein